MRKTSSITAGERELQRIWQMVVCKNLAYHYFDAAHGLIILIKSKLFISVH